MKISNLLFVLMKVGVVWQMTTAKCPFSCIIMEKGGYWVGVLLCCGFVLSLSLSFSITFFSLSLSL